jgi:hypothetical protein
VLLAELHHLYSAMAPDPGKNLDGAAPVPVAPVSAAARTLIHSKPNFLNKHNLRKGSDKIFF